MDDDPLGLLTTIGSDSLCAVVTSPHDPPLNMTSRARVIRFFLFPSFDLGAGPPLKRPLPIPLFRWNTTKRTPPPARDRHRARR